MLERLTGSGIIYEPQSVTSGLQASQGPDKHDIFKNLNSRLNLDFMSKLDFIFFVKTEALLCYLPK